MLRISLAATALALVSCQQAPSVSVPEPAPQFDTALVDAALQGLIDSEALAGGGILVFQGGEEIYFGAAGHADRGEEKPWERDTLAAIYSMTKPVTGVVLLTLYEDGLFDLDDPVADYLPEYQDVKVFAGMDPDGEIILEEPVRPLQIIDLMRHTSCHGYGWGSGPVDELARATEALDPRKSLQEMSEDIATIPLECHPGTKFVYGVAVDIQARLAEVLAGKPYEELLIETIIEPLGMSDTGYFVPAEDKPRVASVYTPAEEGGLKRGDNSGVYSHWTQKPVQTNGGHGLISTVDDFMRFALMLQNEGSLDGVRILKPETVAMMTSDQLPHDTMEDYGIIGEKDGYTFGLNVSIRTTTVMAPEGRYGVKGEYTWDGAASTTWWVDPENDITAVFLQQTMPWNSVGQDAMLRAVYQAAGIAE